MHLSESTTEMEFNRTSIWTTANRATAGHGFENNLKISYFAKV